MTDRISTVSFGGEHKDVCCGKNKPLQTAYIMKNLRLATALFAICFILACTKETGTIAQAPEPQGSTSHSGVIGRSGARYAGPDYSQSIPVDTANAMIQSYLTSIEYPSKDTALRALTFDADTLRAYLSNPNIVSIKFIMAHQPVYKNSNKRGKYAGMNPQAMTMIVVGLNSNNQYVLNNRNEVYEHFSPCPNNCQFNGTPYIQ